MTPFNSELTWTNLTDPGFNSPQQSLSCFRFYKSFHKGTLIYWWSFRCWPHTKHKFPIFICLYQVWAFGGGNRFEGSHGDSGCDWNKNDHKPCFRSSKLFGNWGSKNDHYEGNQVHNEPAWNVNWRPTHHAFGRLHDFQGQNSDSGKICRQNQYIPRTHQCIFLMLDFSLSEVIGLGGFLLCLYSDSFVASNSVTYVVYQISLIIRIYWNRG